MEVDLNMNSSWQVTTNPFVPARYLRHLYCAWEFYRIYMVA